MNRVSLNKLSNGSRKAQAIEVELSSRKYSEDLTIFNSSHDLLTCTRVYIPVANALPLVSRLFFSLAGSYCETNPTKFSFSNLRCVTFFAHCGFRLNFEMHTELRNLVCHSLKRA